MKLKRMAIGLFATLACFYPTWLFILNGVGIQKTAPGLEDYSKVCNWDCLHYAPMSVQVVPSAFFPLFPWIAGIWPHGVGISGNLGVLITSNLFSILAGMLILFAGKKVFAPASPDVYGFPSESWILLALVTFFPHFHFWLQGYPEPLFFCALLAGFLFLLEERWNWACAFLGITAVIRPQGIWAVGLAALVLVVGFFNKLEDSPKRFSEIIPALLILVLPFSIFCLWNQSVTGSPFYFLQEQKKWGRTFDLLLGLRSHLPRFDEGTFYLYLSLWAAYTLLKERKSLAWVFIGLLTLAFAEIPLFYGAFMSYSRFASINLGIFLALTLLFTRRPQLLVPWLIWSVSRLAVFTHNMTFGMWTG